MIRPCRPPAAVRLALAAALLGVAGAAGLHLFDARNDGDRRERGRALYEGEGEALAGRLAGHDVALPPSAARCANCHEAAARPRAALGTASLDTATPLLDRKTLAEPLPRRGGPASRYDAAALCRLLRTGIDPASILVSAPMPRFDPTDAQCADLWTYLVSR